MLVTKVIMPSNKYGIKCPYSMNPEGISIHNTANDASAMSEISYMINNNNKISFHEAIDDYRVVQGIEHNRNAWHAGDGHGFGNMKTIGIEICYSKSGGDRFTKAEQNAAERIAYLMKQYGWNLDKITDTRHTIGTHQNRSGKYCPHRTLDNGIERFYNMIREEYKKLTEENITGTPNIVVNESNNNTGRKIEEVVTINGVYTSSSATKKLNPVVKSGTITKIILGARNPYLLNGGNIGWVNDNCIVSSISSQEQINTNAHDTYLVKVTATALNIRQGVGTGTSVVGCIRDKGTYTIVETQGNWGKLKSGIGWICLDYTQKISKIDIDTKTEPIANFVKGQKVLLKLSAAKYCTGQTIPSSIKGKSYTIMQVGSGNTHPDGVLLKEIMSWVYKSDIQ